MTSRRPPSQRDAGYVDQRQSRQLQSFVPGALTGRLASAGPVTKLPGPPDALFGFDGGSAAVASRASKVDIFTLPSDGAQDLTLTFVPIEDSWNLLHNRLGCVEAEHFTLTGRTVSLLSGTDALTGDTVRVQYDYLVEQSDPIAGGFYSTAMGLGPLAYWRLGDVSNGGTLTDSSGNAHHGTWNAVSSHTPTTGLLNDDSDQAALLTGTAGEGAVVSYGSWMNQTNLSWVCLVNTADFIARLVARESSNFVWSVQLAGGQPRFSANGLVIGDAPTPVNDGATHLLVLTYDGSTVRFYTDGTLDASFAVVLTTPTSSDITIGYGGGTGGGQMFAGVLDEAVVYARVLSAVEVSALWGSV